MEKLFSAKFPDLLFHSGSKTIQAAILSIEKLAVDKSIRVFSALNGYIGISFKINISIPSRGTVNGIDIREIEPIFILIKSESYPYLAPRAYSDRLDFPTENLPHLNPVPKGFPANFCLHRGDVNEWFCEHTIEEFVFRIICWLRDAARNRLIKLKNQDEFEITRISKSYGYNVFNPNEFISLLDYDEQEGKRNYSFLWYEIIKNDPLIDDDKINFSIKYSLKLSPENQNDILKLTNDINKLEESKNSLNKRNIGILLYPPQDFITEKYYSSFPSNFKDFEEWCKSLNLDINEAFDKYFENKFHCLGGIPLSIIIRRPRNLISTDSNLEILNFVIGAGGDFWPKENKVNENSKVYILENRKPVDLQFAKELSNLRSDVFNNESIFIGCGAVGSKLIMHLAKSGLNNYEVIDGDKLSPHNLVRHALLSNRIGKNKAEAIKEEIQNIFYSDKSNLKVKSHNIKGEKYLKSLTNTRLQKVSAIIDTTASNNFQLFLSDYNFNSKTICIRCEIAFDGKLGIMKKEGSKRMPRLDDINIYLIDLSIEDSYISSWLQDFDNKRKNGGFEFEEINVGVSCNSNTLKLSDDVISLHTSAFSLGIKNSSTLSEGVLQLTMISENPVIQVKTKLIIIGKVLELRFKNDSDWKLRIREELTNELFKELDINKPNETGGLLIGKVDVKRKIIYITRITPAPADSIKKPYYFIRGTKNVPEEIEEFRQKSGGLIDYVGEWHTHPKGGSKPSDTDFTAVNELRSILDKIPYPTFITIVTPTKLNPYIFGPKSLIH